ncbi:putative NAD/FAD-binding protein [Thioflavicoccus mobilis 8321]|uniref:Putative NAD/FAD-binding protein n=1 Tax=Thioflavicoccus mobilis 8321 TaxID=765912 RepID=L0GWT8_9GAMM|nr:FAD-dependent oxidoreductase [Thioflavicoccus mobilis]AGA89769.1 putative NAD/FAD-binding protein [Thioflavicoccus mobilis 8321]
MESVQQVAVVGSGISGLAAAWCLGQRHDVTLLEKDAKLGGHTNTTHVEVDERRLPVDTGFIVFNRPNYPHLTAMLRHLRVETQPTRMGFSVSIDGGRIEYSGDTLSTLFAQRSNLFSLSHWSMIRQILRFNRQAKCDLQRPEALITTLGDYLARHGFDERLRQRYLLPMAAAIWSCPVETMMQFPADSFLRFFENHGLLNVRDQPQWESLVGGSQRYIDAMLEVARFDVRLDSRVERVTHTDGGLEIRCGDGTRQRFDHVVLASHSDQSFAMLDERLKENFAPLGRFRYQENLAYLHRDTALMPRRRRAWASWNYLRDTRYPENRVAVTYWMNMLQNIATETPLLVTLNPITPPAADRVFEEIRYEHPVFDQAAIDGQGQIKARQGRSNVWLCGAYLGNGFHEDGLRSAVELARAWGLPLPWESIDTEAASG